MMERERQQNDSLVNGYFRRDFPILHEPIAEGCRELPLRLPFQDAHPEIRLGRWARGRDHFDARAPSGSVGTLGGA